MKNKWIYIGLINVVAILFFMYSFMLAKGGTETWVTALVGFAFMTIYIILRIRYIKASKAQQPKDK